MIKIFSRFSKKKISTIDQIETTTTTSKLTLQETKELMLDQVNASDEMGLQRIEAYVERPVQQLLRKLLENRQAEISPTYDLIDGFRFTTVESLLDDKAHSKDSAESLLNRLNQLDILVKQFFDAVSVCPHCQSAAITIHTCCPKCTSRCIVKTSLTEHIPCGNIAERERFVHEVCPKCGDVLVHGQYRDMGRWYICRACHERFEAPQLDLICRKCSNEFTTQNALIQMIYKYTLNPARESEVRQNVTSLESIHALLTKLGFVVEMPGSIIGDKSGIQQYFTIIATKPDEKSSTLVIDHRVNEREVSASELILFIYKLSEIQVDLAIFIAIPRLSETAKRIAEGYQILVVEGSPTDNDKLSTLNNAIHERLTQIESQQSLPAPPIEDPILKAGFEQLKRLDERLKRLGDTPTPPPEKK